MSMIAPVVSSVLDAQFTNLSYIGQGFFRISGEKIGLPQAIPNDRKMDYQYLSFFMVFASTYIMELSYRLMDRLTILPNLANLLRLNQLKKQYTHQLPKAVEAFPIRDYTKSLPHSLSPLLMGSFVKPGRTAYLIPNLMQEKVVPDLIKRGASADEINEAKLLAYHHLPKVLMPYADYLEKYAAHQGYSPKALASVKKQLQAFEDIGRQLKQKKQVPAEVLQKLTQMNPESPFLQTLAQANLKEHSLVKVFWNSFNRNMGPKKALQQYKERLKYSAGPLLTSIRDEIFTPYMHQKYGATSQVSKLFEDLSQSHINLKKLKRLFESSKPHIKVPASVLFMFVFFGLGANLLNNSVILPYQKSIVKRRGDSTEIVMPGYLGALPGIATFLGLMKMKPVQKMGYFGSFAFAGAAGLAAYAASTMAMFQYKLSKPRNDKPAATVAKQPPTTTPAAPQVNPFAAMAPIGTATMPSYYRISPIGLNRSFAGRNSQYVR